MSLRGKRRCGLDYCTPSRVSFYPLLQLSEQKHRVPSQRHRREDCLHSHSKSHKKPRTFERGTFVAPYEVVKVPFPSTIATIYRIHNDLLPQTDQITQKGTRVQRLQELIKTQNWEHLVLKERTKLESLFLENDPLFILSEK